MVKKTSKQLKKTKKKVTKKTGKILGDLKSWVPAPREASTLNDVKTAVLLVSLAINLAVFIGWLALRLTTDYDQQVFDFLFVR